MNTLRTPLNTARPSDCAAGLGVRRACGLMLASLLVAPAHAERAKVIREIGEPQIVVVGQGTGPAVMPPVPAAQSEKVPKGVVPQGEGPQKATPPGAGPSPASVQVVNATPPPAAAARTLPAAPTSPPTSIPAPGAGNTDVPILAARSSPPPPNKGGPSPGAGPTTPGRIGQNPMPGAGSTLTPDPVARVTSPVGPMPGTGAPIASPTLTSGTNVVNSVPTTPGGGGAPASLAPTGISHEVRPRGATHGAGANITAANTTGAVQPVPLMQGNPLAGTQAGSVMVASLSPSNAPSATGIVEILPSAQKLSESMRELPTVQQGGMQKDVAAGLANNDKCVSVNLRPDTQRPGLSLVDLTGDGLIVSAVSDAHIQMVFAKAGYGQVDLSQTARWCVTQTAARALVRPSPSVGTQQAALLVQTGTGLQLMSQDQWAAHQASVKPLVTAMTASKSSKLSKPTNRLVVKRSGKTVTGVAVSALRLPASTGKTSAGA